MAEPKVCLIGHELGAQAKANWASLPTHTTRWRQIGLERRHSPLAANRPPPRLGRPSDVAPVVAFVASAEARWSTGQLIPVPGGDR